MASRLLKVATVGQLLLMGMTIGLVATCLVAYFNDLWISYPLAVAAIIGIVTFFRCLHYLPKPVPVNAIKIVPIAQVAVFILALISLTCFFVTVFHNSWLQWPLFGIGFVGGTYEAWTMYYSNRTLDLFLRKSFSNTNKNPSL